MERLSCWMLTMRAENVVLIVINLNPSIKKMWLINYSKQVHWLVGGDNTNSISRYSHSS